MSDNIFMQKEIILIDDFDCKDEMSHGEACIHIIKNIYPKARVKTIGLKFHNGKTDITELLKALEWCIVQQVKLIHLSLGTVNYNDSLKLKIKINMLIEQGSIIVTAFHNANIITWPAIFPKVFGVIQDRDGFMENGQYSFVSDQLGKKDIIIAHYSDELLEKNYGKICAQWSNSFAAPVITAIIYQYMGLHTGCNYQDVINYLKINAVNNKRERCLIQRYPILDGESSIPNIAMYGNGKWQDELIRLFRSEEYRVEILEEDETFYIPLHLYLPYGSISKKLIKGIEYIYKADVFLYILKEISHNRDIEISIFDVNIIENRGIFNVIRNDHTEKNYVDIMEMYQEIKSYFQ